MSYKDYKLELISFVLLIILMISIFWGVFPLWKKLEAKSDKFQALLLDQEINQKLLSQLPKLKQESQIIDNNQKNLDLFFSKEQALALAKELENIAKETNNEIIIKAAQENQLSKKDLPKNKKNKQESSQDKKNQEVIPILNNYLSVTIKLKGTSENTLSFIKELNKIPYLFTILSVTVTQQENSDLSGKQAIRQESYNDAYFKKITSNFKNSLEQDNTSENEEKLETPVYYTTLKVVFYTQDNLTNKK